MTMPVPIWLDGVLGDWLPDLIMTDAPLVRVNAGPGSGKTTGLKRRVQRLILDKGVEPQRIFVGTFTRAITTELTESGYLMDETDIRSYVRWRPGVIPGLFLSAKNLPV